MALQCICLGCGGGAGSLAKEKVGEPGGSVFYPHGEQRVKSQ